MIVQFGLFHVKAELISVKNIIEPWRDFSILTDFISEIRVDDMQITSSEA